MPKNTILIWIFIKHYTKKKNFAVFKNKKSARKLLSVKFLNAFRL